VISTKSGQDGDRFSHPKHRKPESLPWGENRRFGRRPPLTDLVFNVGSSAMTSDKSPSLMSDMGSGDYQGMSGQLRYTKDDSGGHPPGLVTRSDDRQSIFLGNDPN
jgi:GH24 family phage-related lysozyme (muramidase)